MTPGKFDPERYLRTQGERLVVAAGRPPGDWDNGALLEAATTLVSFGVIDAGSARRVLEAYAAALRPFLRPASSVFRFPDAPDRDPPPEPLAPRRAFAIDTEITSAQGRGRARVRWLTLAESRLTLGISAIRDGAMTGPPPRAAPSVDLATPDGHEFQATFAGGWTNGQLDGIFSAAATVGPDTPWLEIEGTRVELNRSSAPPDVRVTAPCAADPAIAYVRLLVADIGNTELDSEPGAPAFAALQAAGLISREEAFVASVAPEWRHRERTAGVVGPARTLGVGAVTPVFDGICLAVDALLSGADRLWLELELSGARLGHRDVAMLTRNPLALWAADDCGNVYFGQVGRWSGDPEARIPRRAAMVFPALDPAATELRVTVETPRAQSAIRIAL